VLTIFLVRLLAVVISAEPLSFECNCVSSFHLPTAKPANKLKMLYKTSNSHFIISLNMI
jgi:hypothetical protein